MSAFQIAVQGLKAIESAEEVDAPALALQLYLLLVARASRGDVTTLQAMQELAKEGYTPSFHINTIVPKVGRDNDEGHVPANATYKTYDFYVTTPAGRCVLVGVKAHVSFFEQFAAWPNLQVTGA